MVHEILLYKSVKKYQKNESYVPGRREVVRPTCQCHQFDWLCVYVCPLSRIRPRVQCGDHLDQ